jgi:hypothetical protein
MSDWSEKFADEVEDLRRVRDEVQVQLHLGKEEARARWEDLEKHWEHLEGRLKVIRDGSQESLEEIGEAARLLAGEIRKGYKNLRDLL